MIRRAFASGLPKSGLEGSAAPVAGSTRMIEPSSVVGSLDVRRSWLRSEPPSALGGDHRAADTARRVTTGVDRVPVLPVVGEREAGSVAGTRVKRPVRAELDRSRRVARVLLAPVLDQHLLRAGHHVAARLESREASADHAAVGGRARGRGAGVPPTRRRARRAELVVVGVEDVDVRVGREVRVERHPEQAAIPEVVDVRREVRERRSVSGRRSCRRP